MAVNAVEIGNADRVGFGRDEVDEKTSRLRRAWWGVVARFLVHGWVVSTWVSRIAGVKTGLHLGDGALGFSLLGAAVGSVTAIPITGWLVTKYGSKKMSELSTAGFCLVLVLPALAVNAWTLFAALFCWGFMAGANDVSMNANAVDVEKLMGKPTISRFHAMFSIGGITGAALGGAIASAGVSPLVHLAGASAVLLVFTSATAGLMMDTRAMDASGVHVRSAKIPWHHLPPGLFLLAGIGFCIFLSEGAIADWTAVYLAQILRAGPGLAAQGYAVFSASMAFFRFTGDAITARLGRPATIRLGGILAALGMTWVLAAPSAGSALPGLAIAGAGYSSIIPLVFAAGGRIKGVDPGVGVATVSGLGYLGFLFGPPVIGAISELTNLRVGLSLLVVLAVTAAMLVSSVYRSVNDSV